MRVALTPARLIYAGACLISPLVLHAQTNPLPFRPVTAEYSAALNRIIMISANPNQLHIYDAAFQSDVLVNLPKTPLSVSVGPDGLHAVVGHDALVSYVNLQTAAVETTFPVQSMAQSVVLASAYIYVLPTYSGGATWIKIATGAGGQSSFGYATGGRLHPAGKAIYGTRDGTSPNDIEKYDISTGPVTGLSDSPYHGDYSACGKVWFSPDGTRIYNGCPDVYRASTDPALEMTYVTTFPGMLQIQSLTESAAIKRVAVVPTVLPYYYNPGTQNDNEVRLFESDHLNPAGHFIIPDFVVAGKSYQAHGKWIFYDAASSSLYVVIQADGASGLLNDFAIYTIPIANPAPCLATFAVSTASVIGSGSLATAAISAGAACIYQAVSNAPWIVLDSGAYGSGNGTLSYLVRPNPGPASRTGTISLGNQNLTVNQDAPAPVSLTDRLSYPVVDSEYSKALDKIVLISAGPNELHIYDPITRSDQIIPLSSTPVCVSVRPDGLYAAVGQFGWISYVNLQTATVEREFVVDTDVHDIVLAGNGYIYAFPQRDWSDIFSLEVATAKLTPTSAIYDGRIGRLHVSGKFLYLGGSWGSKWDISGGVAKIVNSYSNNGGCGNLWLTEDGNRILTACGKVYRSSEIAGDDFSYNGTYSPAYSVSWAAHSSTQQSAALITGSTSNGPFDTVLQVYGDSYLGYSGQLGLPAFTVGANTFGAHGRFVFWNAAASKLFVVMKADATSKLASDAAVFTVAPYGAGCTFSLGTTSFNEPSTGVFDSVAVTSGAACVWTSQSSAPWLSITTGTYSFGSGAVAFSIPSNPTPFSRTATLTVAGQTVTVTQAGSQVASFAIVKSHNGNFGAGQQNATYTITVSNNAQAFAGSGTVTVTDTLPPGLTLVSMAGNGWACNANVCTRSDALSPGAAYSVITVTVNVLANAASPQANQAGVSGGGSVSASTSDSTTITPPVVPACKPGVFRQGFLWVLDANGNHLMDDGPSPGPYVFGFGGLPGDIPVWGDWNGNGHNKVGFVRNGNQWHLDYNGDRSVDKQYTFGGAPGDIPVVGDWTGDGKTKIGIYRNGIWILDLNGNGIEDPAEDSAAFGFGGIAGDVPVVGDWTGTGTSKAGIFRQGFLWILDTLGNHTNGAVFPYGGIAGDKPVVGDWAGSGVTQVGIFRQGFLWVLDANGNRLMDDGPSPGPYIFGYGGINGDVPISGKW